MWRCFSSLSLAILFTTQLVAADTVETRPNGVYRAGYGNKGTEYPRSDEGTGTVRLGKLISDQIKDVEIISLSNDNELFRMNFKSRVPSTVDPDFRYMAVCINNCVMPIWSQAEPKLPDSMVQLGARIQGKKVMQKIAIAYDIKPQLRKHPGHKFLVHWVLDKKEYAPGEKIDVTLRITNVGKKPFWFRRGGMNRAARDQQFAFVAMRSYGNGKPVPDIGDGNNFGGISQQLKVEPGKSLEIPIQLNLWFKLDTPDTYQVTGIYRMPIGSGDGKYGTVWDDFAVGEFKVVITEKKEEKKSDKPT
ncbi:MAG: hypothetical protein COA78_05420 [Blastopirellula sp.]|nr:MAG: hypothetical protein COA78_05420 [Blastopirellula sp.]